MFTDQAPVFIASSGRSGSQMLARVLALHPALLALHEPYPQLATIGMVKQEGTRPDGYIRDHLRRKRIGLLREARSNRLHYVESSGFCSNLIPELHDLFGARFIHIYRDGRSFVRSGLERAWFDEHPEPLKHRLRNQYIRWLRRRYLLDIGDVWEDRKVVPDHLQTRIEKIAWLWVRRNEDILAAFAQLPASETLSIRLETFDLDTLRRIHDFLGIEFLPDLADEMMETSRSRPNRSAGFSVPAPAEWSDADQERFMNIAGPTMRKLGYLTEPVPVA